jgi:hypothetical protein
VLSFQADKKPFPILSIQLEEVGFSSRLEIRTEPEASVRGRVQSATNMVLDLELLKPGEFLTLELFDPRTRIRIPVVIATPEEPPKEESNEGTPATPAKPKTSVKEAKKGSFFAFSRAAFGIVMVRTDGKRLLVYTNSAQNKLKEAYAYALNKSGKPEPTPVLQI